MELIGHTNVFRMIGDMLHLLSVLIVLHKMLKMRSSSGISLRSQLAYAIVFTTRYIPTLGRHTSLYLIVMKFFFLLTSWYIVFLMRTRNPWKATYDSQRDCFRMRYLIGPCIVLALLFHYDKPHQIVELLWTFSQYLEAVAIVPQLYLLTVTLEQGRQWELITGHYVFCLGMYRVFYIFNWLYRYFFEGSQWNWVDSTSGIVQTLLFTEFFYTYIKGLKELKNFGGLPMSAGGKMN